MAKHSWYKTWNIFTMPLNFLWSHFLSQNCGPSVPLPIVWEHRHNYKQVYHSEKKLNSLLMHISMSKFCAWGYFANLSSNHENLELQLSILWLPNFTSITIYANKVSGEMPSPFVFFRRKIRGFIDWVVEFIAIVSSKKPKNENVGITVDFWVIF